MSAPLVPAGIDRVYILFDDNYDLGWSVEIHDPIAHGWYDRPTLRRAVDAEPLRELLRAEGFAYNDETGDWHRGGAK